jgi:hypothetical protein
LAAPTNSDIRTTRRYYLKMQPEFIAAARAAVEAALEVKEWPRVTNF